VSKTIKRPLPQLTDTNRFFWTSREDGKLPMNTNGGQLSAGRLHGYGFLHESCVQLLGEAGERQVPNNPQTAVATSGGGVPGSALLLRTM
jgi:hypothetical protein